MQMIEEIRHGVVTPATIGVARAFATDSAIRGTYTPKQAEAAVRIYRDALIAGYSAHRQRQ